MLRRKTQRTLKPLLAPVALLLAFGLMPVAQAADEGERGPLFLDSPAASVEAAGQGRIDSDDTRVAEDQTESVMAEDVTESASQSADDDDARMSVVEAEPAGQAIEEGRRSQGSVDPREPIDAPTAAMSQPRSAGTDVSEYKLGPGDIVEVTVFEYPDLTAASQITGAGDITFPLLGQVSIGGLSRGEAEAKIADLLKSGDFVRQAQVNLSILEYGSQFVSVLGQVNIPGKYPLSSPVSTVTDLLSEAGGLTAEGSDVITVIKDEQGTPVKTDVDLVDLFRGDMEENIQVANGDVIYVPSAPVFYIYGEVQDPGPYRVERGLTVMQALSLGGGLTDRGTQNSVILSRLGANGEQEKMEVTLADIVEPNDVIYVKESWF